MKKVKEAQFTPMAPINQFPVEDMVVLEPYQDEQVNLEVGNDTTHVVQPGDTLVFEVPEIPGADGVVDDSDLVVEEAPKKEEQFDPWDWRKTHGLKSFLHWVKQMIDGVPKHSGKHVSGVLRAKAYFERLEKELKRAMTEDYGRDVDAAKADEARDAILQGLSNLNKRLDKLETHKKNKYGMAQEGMVKRAETSTVGRIVITVPYLISYIARTCINASVSNGKDMKDVFEKLASEYKLDKREKVEVVSFIKDMGYPLIMIDRVNIDDKDIDITKGEGELAKNYPV